eukprot:TRINITY_DN2721_c0_g1_i2.p2 TRINITY_DN2721_c0_g1~~TRINITY_DN2721_c0_g1_i2.p2  ORF type:complete len:210 (+),score=30.43 TRINITY_DN2721_c0_g1_i2:712-1341(+)
MEVDSQMAGLPDITLRILNASSIDDIGFHPCVRLKRWEQEKTISFIPPDGKFQMAKYLIRNSVQMPIYVKPQILVGEQTGTVHVMIGSKHTVPRDKDIEDIVVTIPFSKNCIGTNLTSKFGVVIFDEVTKICHWKMSKLPKVETPILEGNFTFDPEHPPAKPTVSVNFMINMWAASGLKVDSMTLTNEKYSHFKGVRSITSGGQIQIRC